MGPDGGQPETVTLTPLPFHTHSSLPVPVQGPHKDQLHLFLLVHLEVHSHLHFTPFLLEFHCVVDEGNLLNEIVKEGDVVLALLKEEGIEPSLEHVGRELTFGGKSQRQFVDFDGRVEVALCEDLLRSGFLVLQIYGTAVALFRAHILHFG